MIHILPNGAIKSTARWQLTAGLLVSVYSIHGQTSLSDENKKILRNQLDSMVSIDQEWRNTMRHYQNGQRSNDTITYSEILQNIRETDSLNYYILNGIFSKFGFVHYDLLDSISSHNFWLLVQHQDRHPQFQDSVLLEMRNYCIENKASFSDYAYLLDRVKINTGQLQVYGTQVMLNSDATGFIPKPVIEPENLNQRRNSVGLINIEDYLKLMNERYNKKPSH